jgi:hypothetical protein
VLPRGKNIGPEVGTDEAADVRLPNIGPEVGTDEAADVRLPNIGGDRSTNVAGSLSNCVSARDDENTTGFAVRAREIGITFVASVVDSGANGSRGFHGNGAGAGAGAGFGCRMCGGGSGIVRRCTGFTGSDAGTRIGGSGRLLLAMQ